VGIFADAAAIIDPDHVVERPELRTPVTLASHLDSRYQVRAHLRVIGDELDALERGDFDRLLLNTAPQTGKSTTATEWGAFWWLCRNPTARIVVGSYGDDRAVPLGRAIKKLVETYGMNYGLVLERGAAAVKHWNLTTGGGVRSVGVGSSITGFSADLVIVDDPTKSRAEAESQARRDAIFNWYSADILSRQQPGTKVMIVQTPWHVDDLRARVVQQEGDRADGGRWRVVIMPAICEDPKTDPLGRSPGEPLPHPKIPDGAIERLVRYWERIRSAQTVRDWRALYQCDPRAPEGALLSWALLRERRCHEVQQCSTPQRIGVAVDPSGGGRDTAGVVAGYLGEDGRCHFTHDASGVMSSDAWGRAACELAADTGADFFVAEKNYGGDMVKLMLRTSWDALRREQPDRFGPMVPRIIEVTAKRGKMLRAEPVAQQWVENRIVTAAYLPDLESEWATYTPGTTESPGRIDASVYLALELLPVPSSGASSVAGAVTLSETDLFGGMFGGTR
jgi:hypothetical protein